MAGLTARVLSENEWRKVGREARGLKE